MEEEMIAFFKKCMEDSYNRWFEEGKKLYKEISVPDFLQD
jgi:hypothetical protein